MKIRAYLAMQNSHTVRHGCERTLFAVKIKGLFYVEQDYVCSTSKFDLFRFALHPTTQLSVRLLCARSILYYRFNF